MTAEVGLPGPPLPRAFYARPVLVVARACIGKLLVTRTPEGVTAGRIVECEAYRGPEDLAAHSAGGRRTARTEVMYGPPGHAYMFRLYGMHWAFNLVAASEGEPHAVLVRAIEPTIGIALMAARRGIDLSRFDGAAHDAGARRAGKSRARTPRELTNGPGKLCEALGLTGADYGADLCGGRVFLVDGPRHAPVGCSPRINVEYAGVWARRPWRFYERGNRFVSVPPRA